MRKKKRTIKLINVDAIRSLNLKAIQLDPSKVYVVELNDLKAGFAEKA